MRSLTWWTAAALILAPPLRAQSTAGPVELDPPVLLTVSLGVGGGTQGVAGQASGGLLTPLGDFFLRVAGTSEFNMSKVYEDSDSEIAVLYGRRVTLARRAWIRVAAGPARVKTVRQGPTVVTQTQWSYSSHTDEVRTHAFGMATQLDLALGTPRLAGGLGLLANFNGEHSFWVAGLSVHVGIAP